MAGYLSPDINLVSLFANTCKVPYRGGERGGKNIYLTSG